MSSPASPAKSKTPAPAASVASAGRLTALCKAVADPLRLEVMRVLSNDSFGVQELARIFEMPQPGMSHHLKILAKVELVHTRRQGNSIFYRRALLRGDDELASFLASLYATIETLALTESVQTNIDKTHAERAEQSRLFFARNAAKFSEHQAQLCELDQYLPNLRELLDVMELAPSSRVLEVGPGAGDLLRELAKRFDRVVALDNSEEMLSITRRSLSAASRERVEFINASLEDYSAGTQGIDAVVLNMVLHHMSSPRHAFQRVRDLLSEGGCLLVADLCSHDQEWVRESCGDVWLGFEPQELREWAQSAGFGEPKSMFLGLKNGFQIQIQSFRAGI